MYIHRPIVWVLDEFQKLFRLLLGGSLLGVQRNSRHVPETEFLVVHFVVNTGACLDLDNLIADSVKDQFANRTATELFHDIGAVRFDGLDAYV